MTPPANSVCISHENNLHFQCIKHHHTLSDVFNMVRHFGLAEGSLTDPSRLADILSAMKMSSGDSGNNSDEDSDDDTTDSDEDIKIIDLCAHEESKASKAKCNNGRVQCNKGRV